MVWFIVKKKSDAKLWGGFKGVFFQKLFAIWQSDDTW